MYLVSSSHAIPNLLEFRTRLGKEARTEEQRSAAWDLRVSSDMDEIEHNARGRGPKQWGRRYVLPLIIKFRLNHTCLDLEMNMM